MARDTCQGTKADGSPCGSPVVKGDGYCPAHGPEGRERMAEIGRKGAKATAERWKGKTLDEGELPPLTTAEAAETWCDVVGRAVVTGRLSHTQAQAALRAAREWRESHDAGRLSDRLDALTDALAEWRKTGDPERVLKLVDGGSA